MQFHVAGLYTERKNALCGHYIVNKNVYTVDKTHCSYMCKLYINFSIQVN